MSDKQNGGGSGKKKFDQALEDGGGSGKRMLDQAFEDGGSSAPPTTEKIKDLKEGMEEYLCDLMSYERRFQLLQSICLSYLFANSDSISFSDFDKMYREKLEEYVPPTVASSDSDSDSSANDSTDEPLLPDDPAAKLEASAKFDELVSTGAIDSIIKEDSTAQLDATTELVNQLSKGSSVPLMEMVIKAGVVPPLVKFLTMDDVPKLQAMAACALTLIGGESLDHVKVVAENGPIPSLMRLISNGSSDLVQTQAILALHNIVVLSVDIKILLKYGALTQLLSMLQSGSTTKEHLSMVALMIIENFAEICDDAHKKILIDNGALTALKHLITKSDKSILTDVCWTIAHIARGRKDHLQAVIDEQLITPLVRLMKGKIESDLNLRKAAAYAIYIVSGGKLEQTRLLPCKECIEALCDHLSSTD